MLRQGPIHDRPIPIAEREVLEEGETALIQTANAQQGCFTTSQAAEAGLDHQALHRRLASGRILRHFRGIYQFTWFPTPANDQTELVVAWLWSERLAVISHETALLLHDLSDALPSRIHLTLPPAWPRRRSSPPWTTLHFAEVGESERVWVGAVPVCSPARAINDVALANGDPAIVEAAATQAITRRITTLRELAPAVAWLASQR